MTLARFAILSLTSLLPAFADADEGSVAVLAFTDRPSVSAVVRQEADFVSLPVTVTSQRTSPSESFAEIRTAVQALIEKARESGGIVVQEGPITLSARRADKSMFSSSYPRRSTAQLNILVPLKEPGRDVFAAALEAQRLVESLQPSGDARYQLGDVQLAVDNPEKARPRVLRAIADDIAKTREAMPPIGTVALSGIEGPVLVRQINDREVELFIDYRLTVEFK